MYKSGEQRIGKYMVLIQESVNKRTVGDNIHSLWDVWITDTETNVKIALKDTVSPYEREDWMESVFKAAKHSLDNPSERSCCYSNATYVTT
tara:strand:- start:1208 stop:1480 length:273 start_codon:yes stop_codon:yes gene_type:complete